MGINRLATAPAKRPVRPARTPSAHRPQKPNPRAHASAAPPHRGRLQIRQPHRRRAPPLPPRLPPRLLPTPHRRPPSPPTSSPSSPPPKNVNQLEVRNKTHLTQNSAQEIFCRVGIFIPYLIQFEIHYHLFLSFDFYRCKLGLNGLNWCFFSSKLPVKKVSS